MSATTTVSSSDTNNYNEHCNMDATIYNRRLLFIIDKAIARVRLVELLTKLVNDEESSLLNDLPNELKKVIRRIKNRYQKISGTIAKKEAEDEEAEEPFEVWSITKSRSKDIDLLKILQHLEDISKLSPDGKSEQIEEDSHIGTFIHCLNGLRQGVELHQKEDASKEKAREKHLKRCQIRNEQAKKEIAVLEEELIAKKTELNTSIIGKNLLINRHQGKIDRILKASREAVEQRINESEAIMREDRNSCEAALEALNTELISGNEKHEMALKEHLLIEKKLRMQRIKIENQLVAAIQRFDEEMRDKQAEEEVLQNEFEDQKRKYEEIQGKLDEQEEEYDELMQEKAAYEQELLEQKLFIFILNRSARRIQRAFRAYKLRKMTKKKSKKGKKGKGKKK